MNSDVVTPALEVTEDSQLDDGEQTPTGEELDVAYGTPIAEHFPVKIENLPLTATSIAGPNDALLSSKILPTQINDSSLDKNLSTIPQVPPRHKKRRVTELKCAEVRWFHRRNGTETKWTSFKG